MSEASENQLRADLGLKPLSSSWAKTEIILGLSSMWMSFHVAGVLGGPPDSLGNGLFSMPLFVLGGYLAMAGSRSHLYQSNNKLIAHVIDQIRKH